MDLENEKYYDEHIKKTKKIVIEVPEALHRDIKLFCAARETTIARMFRTLWRDHRKRYVSEHGWPPKCLDNRDAL